MSRLRLMLTVLVAAALMIGAAACGDDDDNGTDTPPQQDATTAPTNGDEDNGAVDDPGDQQPPSGSGDGVIEINGESISVNEVLRCEPFFEGENDLDLTAIGTGVQLFINVNEGGVLTSHELSLQGSAAGGVFTASAYQGADGSWYDDDDNALDDGPFTVSGNRVSGSMTLRDARDGPDTADVGFDVAIPSEIVDCSL